MRVKLMELCLSPDLGGLELYMVRAAKALNDTFDVISVINARGKLAPYYAKTPYRYAAIEKQGTLLMFGAARQLARLIDAEQVDVVHLHWTKDIPVAVMAKLLSKQKPALVQTRNMTMTKFKNDPYHRLLYRHMDLMLPVTRQVADQLRRFIPDAVRPNIEILYMGSDAVEKIDMPAAKALRAELGMEGRFAVGMVGRISQAKGQHLLIEAIAQMEAQHVQAYFVGHEMQKGYVDQLRAHAEALGVQERVHFLGFMKNPHRFFQVCDAVVLASHHETFGLVLIEAMQVGTAVIGSNSGGVLEIIEEGRSGLLFDVGDPVSLAKVIGILERDPAFMAKIAEQGRERAEMLFSNEKQFAELGKLLAEV